MTGRKKPCRLCGDPTYSRYAVCMAHSDLQAAADEAKMLATMWDEFDTELAALTREDAQATRERERR